MSTRAPKRCPCGSGLPILEARGGAEGDVEGTVAFDAHYWDNARRERGLQREHSAFRRDAGRWFYVGPVQPTRD